MVLIAIICPGLSFLLRGKLFSAILAFILQVFAFCTAIVFGLGFYVWLVTAIWAVLSYTQARADRRNRNMIKAMREGRR
jgi:hypothetical protein